MYAMLTNMAYIFKEIGMKNQTGSCMIQLAATMFFAAVCGMITATTSGTMSVAVLEKTYKMTEVLKDGKTCRSGGCVTRIDDDRDTEFNQQSEEY